MNDLQLAGIGFGLAALLLLVAAFRSGHERQYRVLIAVGLAITAGLLGLVFWDLGSIFDRLGDAANQFQEDLEGIPTEP